MKGNLGFPVPLPVSFYQDNIHESNFDNCPKWLSILNKQ
jgi:hypothetical protein